MLRCRLAVLVRWLAVAVGLLACVSFLRGHQSAEAGPLDTAQQRRQASRAFQRQRAWRQAYREGDLPKLSNRLAPWTRTWTNTIALCSTVRQENTTDLREWLLYYRCAFHAIYSEFVWQNSNASVVLAKRVEHDTSGCTWSKVQSAEVHGATVFKTLSANGLAGRQHLRMRMRKDCETRCRFIGIDHVFLTDNDPAAPSAHLQTQLRDFISTGFLTLYANRALHSQPDMMRRCLREQRHSFNWLAFFDADEFLFVRDRRALLAPTQLLHS
jgi:hypothetical protein